jgi:hypothetical protein
MAISKAMRRSSYRDVIRDAMLGPGGWPSFGLIRGARKEVSASPGNANRAGPEKFHTGSFRQTIS